ncbi:hypothetical protein [Halospeciosus flavus]|uniref:Uncharacterized protein n=1 Tax=Halospeciosus flavus TaxID=3032283 RepID=A0ABD5Z267_9EURY|nr:hypothetical protein [Halospeciosus flavus]
MRRRALLTSAGTSLAVSGLAGCTGNRAGPDESGTTRTTAQTSTDTTATAGAVASVGVPLRQVPESPFSDDTGVERVVRTRSAPASAPLVLDPTATTVSLPEGSVTLSLTNRTDVQFALNPYGWSLWKHVDGTWFHVYPERWPVPLHVLDPGGSHAWALTLDHDTSRSAVTPAARDAPRADGGTVAGLGGGTYAFTVDGSLGEGEQAVRVGLVTRLTFDGPTIDVEPTDRVERTTRDGATVTAVVEGTPMGDDATTHVLTVRRSDHEDARRRIPEQVVRDWRYRNTLPYFESGVDTVRLKARKGSGSIPPFGIDDTRLLRYEGETFAVSSKRVE